MVFKNICVLVLCTKLASALEGLRLEACDKVGSDLLLVSDPPRVLVSLNYGKNLELGISIIITFLPYFGKFMTSKLYVVEETGISGKNHRLTPSHWHLSQTPCLVNIPNQGSMAENEQSL